MTRQRIFLGLGIVLIAAWVGFFSGLGVTAWLTLVPIGTAAVVYILSGIRFGVAVYAGNLLIGVTLVAFGLHQLGLDSALAASLASNVFLIFLLPPMIASFHATALHWRLTAPVAIIDRAPRTSAYTDLGFRDVAVLRIGRWPFRRVNVMVHRTEPVWIQERVSRGRRSGALYTPLNNGSELLTAGGNTHRRAPNVWMQVFTGKKPEVLLTEHLGTLAQLRADATEATDALPRTDEEAQRFVVDRHKADHAWVHGREFWTIFDTVMRSLPFRKQHHTGRLLEQPERQQGPAAAAAETATATALATSA